MMGILNRFGKMWNSAGISHMKSLHIVVIILAGVAVYANTLHVPFVLDDSYITQLGPKSFLEILLHGGSRRIADLTFALNLHVHGVRETGYHLVNIAIHLSTSVLIYCVIDSALEALYGSFSAQPDSERDSAFSERCISLAVALLFVLHPIQTQAVTYIIQRYTSLATFFYLGSIWFFLRWRLVYAKNGTCCLPWFLLCLSLAAGILAMGSKQIAATLPLMLFFLELFLFRGRMIHRTFFIICGVLSIFVVVAVLIQWHGSSLHDFIYDLDYATSEDHTASRMTYFLTQTRVVATYLGLLCWPLNQNLMLVSPKYATLFSVPVIASLALHLFLISMAAFLFRFSRRLLLSHEVQQGILFRLQLSVSSGFMLPCWLNRVFFPSGMSFLSIVYIFLR